MAFIGILNTPKDTAEQQNQAQEQEFQIALNDENNQKAFLEWKKQQSTQDIPEFQKVDNEELLYASEADIPKQTQKISEPKPSEEIAQLQEATAPKRYRNSGIAYFDYKENLSLADAFLAKQLGADIKYIDMNVNMNANVKKTDVGKAKGELSSLIADTKSLLDGVSHYEKTYLNQKNDLLPFSNMFASFGRKLNDATNGFINFSNTDNEKILTRNKMDAYTLGNLMVGGGKKSVQDIKNAGAIIDNTWKSRENYYAGVMAGLENGINYMNEKFRYMDSVGIPISQSDNLSIYLLNELKKELHQAQGGKLLSKKFENHKEALGILNEKGDDGVIEAMQLIYSK